MPLGFIVACCVFFFSGSACGTNRSRCYHHCRILDANSPPTETLTPIQKLALPVLAAQLQSYLEGSSDIRRVNVSQLFGICCNSFDLLLISSEICRKPYRIQYSKFLDGADSYSEISCKTLVIQKNSLSGWRSLIDNQYIIYERFSTLLRLNRKSLLKTDGLKPQKGHFEF
jgi:hypothetical protein